MDAILRLEVLGRITQGLTEAAGATAWSMPMTVYVARSPALTERGWIVKGITTTIDAGVTEYVLRADEEPGLTPRWLVLQYNQPIQLDVEGDTMRFGPLPGTGDAEIGFMILPFAPTYYTGAAITLGVRIKNLGVVPADLFGCLICDTPVVPVDPVVPGG